ncbi:hypothetical protein [Defluviimonas sp. SAOS-178_SWC]|uniref:hypothetical protein n=1 Tax=Defluviimonas sp. SAOS-178_SWC TaxID=3121287 RepID=UPI003221DB1E
MARANATQPMMALRNPEIVGPFSRWPRQKARRPLRSYVALGTTVTAAAVFAHSITPLL